MVGSIRSSRFKIKQIPSLSYERRASSGRANTLASKNRVRNGKNSSCESSESVSACQLSSNRLLQSETWYSLPPCRSSIQTHLTRVKFQGSVDGSLLDDCGEHATSPPSSSTSTKIGSVTVEQPLAKRRQLEAAVNRPQKASGPRKSTGKPPAGGTKTQAKTGTNTSRPAKGKGTLNQKPSQNGEGSASKGPVQRLIRRVHATVEVPIKVEDEEEKLVDSLANDKKADKDPKLSTAIEKAPRFTEQSRMNNKTLPLHVDDDSTPPAPGPLPKRRKSGIERDHNERDKNVYNWRNQEDVNFRHRPPPRRKSIRELRDSDFEYHEREDEEGEDSDTDELNLGVRFLFCFFFGM